jgi:hypothetical protein
VWRAGSEEKQVWKSSVKVERCRYLEAVGCKTACVTLCKASVDPTRSLRRGLSVTQHDLPSIAA